jgi:hypothetical protein
MWKRSHGRTTKAPPDERGGNRYVQPKATASHSESTDAVEKVFSYRAQILRAVSAPMRGLFGGILHQAMNSPVTSAVELKAHRMAIAACFVFRREISRSVFCNFFDSIRQERKSADRITKSAAQFSLDVSDR